MIDFKNVNSTKLSKALHDAADEAGKLMNGLNTPEFQAVMTDDQRKQMKEAQKDLSAIKSRDMVKINDLLSRFNSANI